MVVWAVDASAGRAGAAEAVPIRDMADTAATAASGATASTLAAVGRHESPTKAGILGPVMLAVITVVKGVLPSGGGVFAPRVS
jgi:hypothetical protein